MHRQRVLARVEHTGPERAVGDGAAEMRGELQDIVGGGGRFRMGHNTAALQHEAPVVVGEDALKLLDRRQQAHEHVLIGERVLLDGGGGDRGEGSACGGHGGVGAIDGAEAAGGAIGAGRMRRSRAARSRSHSPSSSRSVPRHASAQSAIAASTAAGSAAVPSFAGLSV